jgi:hypothetical protein
MRLYVLSEDLNLLLIQMVVIVHPLFDAVPNFYVILWYFRWL